MSTTATSCVYLLLVAVACSEPPPASTANVSERSRDVTANPRNAEPPSTTKAPQSTPSEQGRPTPGSETLSPEMRAARAWFLALGQRDAERLVSLAAGDFRVETTSAKESCKSAKPGEGAVTCLLKWTPFVRDAALEQHEIDDTYSVPSSAEIPARLRSSCKSSECIQVRFSGDGVSYIVTLAVVDEPSRGTKVSLMYVDSEVYE